MTRATERVKTRSRESACHGTIYNILSIHNSPEGKALVNGTGYYLVMITIECRHVPEDLP